MSNRSFNEIVKLKAVFRSCDNTGPLQNATVQRKVQWLVNNNTAHTSRCLSSLWKEFRYNQTGTSRSIARPKGEKKYESSLWPKVLEDELQHLPYNIPSSLQWIGRSLLCDSLRSRKLSRRKSNPSKTWQPKLGAPVLDGLQSSRMAKALGQNRSRNTAWGFCWWIT